MSDDSILYERRDAVAVITFNRPDKLNAFDNAGRT
jgi:enoyl-CoA hydratase/carnithine racemase